MFKWLTNLFGSKKEETPVPNVNLSVHDLKPRYILDYDLDSWEVIASYTYKYAGYIAKEYKIRSGSETKFLNVSDSNSLLLSMSQEANINQVDERLRTSVAKGQPIAKLNWNGEEYMLKEQSQGEFTDDNLQDWASFMGWEYVNSDNSKFVYVSKWEDNSIECYTGVYLKEHAISNIIQSK